MKKSADNTSEIKKDWSKDFGYLLMIVKTLFSGTIIVCCFNYTASSYTIWHHEEFGSFSTDLNAQEGGGPGGLGGTDPEETDFLFLFSYFV